MDKQQTLKASCRSLGLIHTRDTLETILHDAETNGISYLDFLVSVTDGEILYKQEKAKNKRTPKIKNTKKNISYFTRCFFNFLFIS